MKQRFVISLFLLLTFACGFSQTPLQLEEWNHPVIRRLEQQDTSVVALRRPGAALVNFAVLDKKELVLYYFTVFGHLFDTLHSNATLPAQLTVNYDDVFKLYRYQISKYLPALAAAKAWLRQEGSPSKVADPVLRGVFDLPAVANAASTLGKLLAVESYEREVAQVVAEFDWDRQALADTLFVRVGSEKAKPGRLTTYRTVAGEYIEYSNADSLSFIRKAIVRPKGSTVYFYDGYNELVDSLPVRAGKLKTLLAERTDVFALYRGWLEWQLQNINDNQHAVQQIVHYRQVKTWAGGMYAVYRENNLKKARNFLQGLHVKEMTLHKKLASLSELDNRLLHQVLQQKYRGNNITKVWMGENGWGVNRVFTRGEKEYELTNHLGNVLATVGDRKISVDANSDGTIDYYTADVLSAQDYYPFGMMMPGRVTGVMGRYGFNGKENDNEVKGEGNQQDYGMRIYDPRLGRFLSVDPITKDYPELTPYQFASNTPIRAVDLDGLEAAIISYGYRVTAILVTGSVSVGAAIDYKGNVKLYTQWSAGMGTGAFAGGGTSLSIYPRATSDQVMGSGINVGGNLGLPGISLGLDLNVSLQQDQVTKNINDVKLGVSGGVKLGSLGPGGAEVHVDYSSATPFLEFNLFEMPKSELIAKIQSEIDDSWFLSMTEEQINNLTGYIYGTQAALKKMFDDNNKKPAATTTTQPSQSTQQPSAQQKPVQKKTEQRQSQQKVTPKKTTAQPDSTKKTTKVKAA